MAKKVKSPAKVDTLSRLPADADSLRARFPNLTERGSQILAAIAEGKENAAIAGALGISENYLRVTLSTDIRLALGFGPEDGGGSIRVRMALIAHGIPVVK